MGRPLRIEYPKLLIPCDELGRQVSQEIVGPNRLRESAKPEDILSTVAAALGTERDTLTGKGGGKNTAKKVAIYVIK